MSRSYRVIKQGDPYGILKTMQLEEDYIVAEFSDSYDEDEYFYGARFRYPIFAGSLERAEEIVEMIETGEWDFHWTTE